MGVGARARDPNFVHLHLHSGYSLLDGACDHERLAETAARYAMPAVAVTDHGNLFGAVGFYRAARKHGVKPIIGCEAYVAPTSRHDRDPRTGRPHHLVLLCENETGYRNLIQLVSASYLEGFYRKPRIDKELLASHGRGLIALSGCLSGEVSSELLAGRHDAAETAAAELGDIFGKDGFFLEVQDHGLTRQREIVPELLRIADRTGLPAIATNDCHYMEQDDARAHDVLLCIQTGKTVHQPNRMKFYTDQFYFKSHEDMQRVFGDRPELLSRTLDIAERCQLELEPIETPFPEFEVPAGYDTDSYFEKVVRDGFGERLEQLRPLADARRLAHSIAEYEDRLENEIGIIQGMRYSGYFLVVWDLVRYSRENAIPVGPGRGSAAGSLVAYAMRITDIDPLQYGLLFERFLNPQRVTLPDIDIDFCMNRRGEVIDYVTEKYGRERVSQIITFGTMAARGVIRDTGRGMQMPFAEVDRLAKMIPAELGITLNRALDQSKELKERVDGDPRVREVMDVARKLEGLARHASMHAAGVVISPRPLRELVPLYKSINDEIMTMYPMGDVEKMGLLKMDFLALTTLTIIDDTLKMLESREGVRLDMDNLALDDAPTYALFANGLTRGVFQFESGGMKDILRRFKPSSIEHLTALNALYRPGPLGGNMIDDFIQRKHGQKKVQYELPELEDILEETYGVIVYQEQVMQIANRVAGYSLGEADLLQRAMGKKKPDEMATQRDRFLEGARENGFDDARKVAVLFDLITKFAGYGFNKSHSAAYAVLAYRTAYLKTHYPNYFMAAVLTSERGNTEKIVTYINECREMGIPILPPDVNASDVHFTPDRDGIRFGLAAIKNVGEPAIRSIVAGKPFRSVFDLCERVDLRSVNKRVLESLIKAGALDSLGPDRARLFGSVDRAVEWGHRKQHEEEVGQGGLFAAPAEDADGGDMTPHADPWPESLQLAYEKETLGFYITGHPLRRHLDEIRSITDVGTADLTGRASGSEVVVAGIVSHVRTKRTKKGDPMADVLLEDLEGIVEVRVFPDTYAKCRTTLVADAPVIVKGRLENDESKMLILAAEFLPLDEARSRLSSRVTVAIDARTAPADLATRLLPVVEAKNGAAELVFALRYPRRGTVFLRPHPYLKVQPDKEFVDFVEGICGPNAVKFGR